MHVHDRISQTRWGHSGRTARKHACAGRPKPTQARGLDTTNTIAHQVLGFGVLKSDKPPLPSTAPTHRSQHPHMHAPGKLLREHWHIVLAPAFENHLSPPIAAARRPHTTAAAASSAQPAPSPARRRLYLDCIGRAGAIAMDHSRWLASKMGEVGHNTHCRPLHPPTSSISTTADPCNSLLPPPHPPRVLWSTIHSHMHALKPTHPRDRSHSPAISCTPACGSVELLLQGMHPGHPLPLPSTHISSPALRRLAVQRPAAMHSNVHATTTHTRIRPTHACMRARPVPAPCRPAPISQNARTMCNRARVAGCGRPPPPATPTQVQKTAGLTVCLPRYSTALHSPARHVQSGHRRNGTHSTA